MLLALCSRQIFFYCAVCIWEGSLVEWAKRPQNIRMRCSFWESLDGLQCVPPVRNTEEGPEKGGRNARESKVSYVQKSRRKALLFILCFLLLDFIGNVVQHNLDKLLNKARGFGSLTVFRERV